MFDPFCIPMAVTPVPLTVIGRFPDVPATFALIAKNGRIPVATAVKLAERVGSAFTRFARSSHVCASEAFHRLDTVTPFSDRGRLPAEQVEWLDDAAATAGADGVPMLVFGHHHAWDPGASVRPDDYFGINPDDTDRLVAVVARRPAIRGYFAGHTHRNRVRRFAATGAVPFVEVACVKDYPGTWAEYRVVKPSPS